MIDLLILCLATASLSLFIDMCMEKDMILYWYYSVIEALPAWLFKPLGGCIYCFGTWVFVLFFFLFRAETTIFALLLGIGLNYLFIKAFEKYVVQ